MRKMSLVSRMMDFGILMVAVNEGVYKELTEDEFLLEQLFGVSEFDVYSGEEYTTLPYEDQKRGKAVFVTSTGLEGFVIIGKHLDNSSIEKELLEL